MLRFSFGHIARKKPHHSGKSFTIKCYKICEIINKVSFEMMLRYGNWKFELFVIFLFLEGRRLYFSKVFSNSKYNDTKLRKHIYTGAWKFFFDVTHKKVCLVLMFEWKISIYTGRRTLLESIRSIHLLALRIANTFERIGLHMEPRDIVKLFFGDDFCLETQCLTMVVVFMIPHTRWHI